MRLPGVVLVVTVIVAGLVTSGECRRVPNTRHPRSVQKGQWKASKLDSNGAIPDLTQVLSRDNMSLLPSSSSRGYETTPGIELGLQAEVASKTVLKVDLLNMTLGVEFQHTTTPWGIPCNEGFCIMCTREDSVEIPGPGPRAVNSTSMSVYRTVWLVRDSSDQWWLYEQSSNGELPIPVAMKAPPPPKEVGMDSRRAFAPPRRGYDSSPLNMGFMTPNGSVTILFKDPVVEELLQKLDLGVDPDSGSGPALRVLSYLYQQSEIKNGAIPDWILYVQYLHGMATAIITQEEDGSMKIDKKSGGYRPYCVGNKLIEVISDTQTQMGSTIYVVWRLANEACTFGYDGRQCRWVVSGVNPNTTPAEGPEVFDKCFGLFPPSGPEVSFLGPQILPDSPVYCNAGFSCHSYCMRDLNVTHAALFNFCESHIVLKSADLQRFVASYGGSPPFYSPYRTTGRCDKDSEQADQLFGSSRLSGC